MLFRLTLAVQQHSRLLNSYRLFNFKQLIILLQIIPYIAYRNKYILKLPQSQIFVGMLLFTILPFELDYIFLFKKAKQIYNMKPKQKLVYKLQNNLQRNPFKREQSKNLRNHGCHSYDFAKLRSYKAFSLNYLNNQSSSLRLKKSNLADNQTDLREQTKKYMIENIEGNKKLAYQQAIFIKKKSIQLKNKLRESNKRQKIQFYNQIDADQEFNNNLIKQIVHQKLMLIKQRYQQQNIKTELNSNQKGLPIHNFVLPQIKNKIIEEIFQPFSNQASIDQLKAKQYLVKQIQNMKQFQINKRILESIKSKSNKNLQKLPRSQSEVIKNDKWKQKYSAIQNKKQSYLKLLERSQPAKNTNMHQKINSQYWTKTNDDQQSKSKQNQPDLRKHLKSYSQFCQVQLLKQWKSGQNIKKSILFQKMKKLQQQLSPSDQNTTNSNKNISSSKNKDRLSNIEEDSQILQNNPYSQPSRASNNNPLNRPLNNNNLNRFSNMSLKVEPAINSSRRYLQNSSQFRQSKHKLKMEQQQQQNDGQLHEYIEVLDRAGFKTYHKQQQKQIENNLIKDQNQQRYKKQNKKFKNNQKESTRKDKINQPQRKQERQIYQNRVFSKLIQQVPMQWQSAPHQMLEEDYDFGQRSYFGEQKQM